MADLQDILLDDGNDLVIENGDIAVGMADSQCIKHIIEAAPGHWKQWPLVGANILQVLNGTVTTKTKRDIRLQLIADGFSVNSIVFNNDILIIDAKR